MARVVLSDTSPLIGLPRVDGVEWLRHLFGRVIVPLAVRTELQAGAALEPALAAAFDSSWLHAPDSEPSGPPLPEYLGAGEQACIRLGVASSGPALVLMDDPVARREATGRGVLVAGTARIIGLAQRRGVIVSAADVFEALLRSDFRIGAGVIKAVLASLRSDG